MPFPSVVDHELTIILPAYNEAARLPRTLETIRTTLEGWLVDYRVVVVDNNSSDSTGKIAEAFGPRFSTLAVPVPGKGAAVRTAMLKATGQVIAFTDADLPFELESLQIGYERIRRCRCEVVFGARDLPTSVALAPRSPWRQIATWGFRQMVRLFVSRVITDTQCGLKVFSQAAARRIFTRTTIDGFAFDAEVIYLTERMGLACERIPVTLVNDEGSTISLRRHALPMLLDLFRVRWQAMQDVYGLENEEPSSLFAFPATSNTLTPA